MKSPKIYVRAEIIEAMKNHPALYSGFGGRVAVVDPVIWATRDGKLVPADGTVLNAIEEHEHDLGGEG